MAAGADFIQLMYFVLLEKLSLPLMNLTFPTPAMAI